MAQLKSPDEQLLISHIGDQNRGEEWTMIICHEHKFIFIKTHKTAGTSIECFLSKFCGPSDVITPIYFGGEKLRRGRGRQNWKYCGNSIFGKALREIPILKNSIKKKDYHGHMSAADIKGRIGSKVWNSYFKFTVDRNPWDRLVSLYFWRQKDGKIQPPFDEFLYYKIGDNKSNFPLYSIERQVAVDFICRYENLEAELKNCLRHIGISSEIDLPRAKGNHRPSDTKDYRKFYNDESREQVREWCSREIELLSYEF